MDFQTRLPPQSVEAEMSLIGSIMMFPEIYDDISGIVTPEDFYKSQHQTIFQAISMIGTNTDIVSVVEYLKTNNKLDVVGGPSYLATICDQVTSASRAKHYARIVKEKSKIRSFIKASSELLDSSYNGNDFESLVSNLEGAVMNLSDEHGRGSDSKPIGLILEESFKTIEAVSTGACGIGIQTGFHDLDLLLVGLQPSDLIILAGRPSMGKTALAMNIVKRIASSGVPGGVFSLEMSNNQLGNRMLSGESRVNSLNLRSGHLHDEHWKKLIRALGTMADLPIYVDDTPALHINELRSRTRIMKRKYDIQYVMIDYLQLMRGNGDNREREISHISSSLKAMSKELNIPVIALSQLNRSLESRPNKRPMLSDLRESGSIEQDADVICFIYRDEVYNRNEDNPNKGIAELIIGKQRNGPTGVVKLHWNSDTTSFNDLAT